ncbi:MAG: hypothetical protein J3Q66DRAFT_427854 [Benniella sp.]|nr:MAG: hypothetical protein J3Q66DRAFT_427854 [Benniella sp.]
MVNQILSGNGEEQFIDLKTSAVFTTEAMNNNAFGCVLRDGTKTTVSGMSASTCHPYDLSASVCELLPQGAANSDYTVVRQALDEGHPLESHPTSPYLNSPPPQSLSMHLQVPTIGAMQPTQQLGLQHLVLTLQLQLERKDRQIQHLQRQLVYHQYQQQYTQHPQQLVDPQAAPLFLQQQLLFQQLVLMDNDPPSVTQPSQIHYPPTPHVSATVNCSTQEPERQVRVETSRKPETKRSQKRLTDEQSRDIISRREGEDPASYQMIANAIGCSKSTVWRQRQKYLRQTKLLKEEDSQ